MNKITQRVIVLLSFFIILIISNKLANRRLPFTAVDVLKPDNPVRVNYEEFEKKFNNERNIYLLLEWKGNKKPSVDSIIKALKGVHHSLRKYYFVEDVISLSNAEFFNVKGDYVRLDKFVEKNKITSLGREKLKTDFWKNYLISENFENLLVSFQLTQSSLNSRDRSVIEEIINFVENNNQINTNWKFHLLGSKIVEVYLVKDAIKTQKYITPFLLLLLGFLIFYLFRDVKVVLCFYFTMILSYSMTIITIFMNDGGISPYSGFAMFFVLIVATSDLIHFFATFNKVSGSLKVKLKKVKDIIYMPCFLTSLTTVIGFISLSINDLLPISKIGLYCSIGSFICFFNTFTVLPFFIEKFNFVFKENVKLPNFKLNKIFDFSLRKPKVIISLFISFMLICLLTTSNLKIDDRFYDKFKTDHPLSQSINMFQEKFQFVDSIDIGITPLFGKANEKDNLIDINLFEKKIESEQNVSYIKSYRLFHEHLKNSFHNKLFEQGVSSDEINMRFNSMFKIVDKLGFFDQFYDKETNLIRTIVFLNDSSSLTINKLKMKVDELSKDFTGRLKFEILGHATLRSYINDNLINGIINSLSMSFILIFLVFLFIFRSLSWALLGMIPNVIPLLFICGLMSLFKITIDSNLVLMVCVTIGIAVDDTIHFLWSLKKNSNQMSNKTEVLKKSYNETSSALLGTTFVFVLSFPCFFFADLKIYSQAGIFVMTSLLFALFADLLFLPALFALKKKF